MEESTHQYRKAPESIAVVRSETMLVAWPWGVGMEKERRLKAFERQNFSDLGDGLDTEDERKRNLETPTSAWMVVLIHTTTWW